MPVIYVCASPKRAIGLLDRGIKLSENPPFSSLFGALFSFWRKQFLVSKEAKQEKHACKILTLATSIYLSIPRFWSRKREKKKARCKITRCFLGAGQRFCTTVLWGDPSAGGLHWVSTPCTAFHMGQPCAGRRGHSSSSCTAVCSRARMEPWAAQLP